MKKTRKHTKQKNRVSFSRGLFLDMIWIYFCLFLSHIKIILCYSKRLKIAKTFKKNQRMKFFSEKNFQTFSVLYNIKNLVFCYIKHKNGKIIQKLPKTRNFFFLKNSTGFRHVTSYLWCTWLWWSDFHESVLTCYFDFNS